MQLAVKVTAAVSRRMQIVENNREENLAMRIYIKNTTTKGETPISSEKERSVESGKCKSNKLQSRSIQVHDSCFH